MRTNIPGHNNFNPDGVLSQAWRHGIETKSALLREWYRQGQKFFRNALQSAAGLEPSLTQALNHHCQGLSDVQKEGFLMGWQSDAYAYDNGLDFSVEGADYVIHESTEGDDYGYLIEAEGRDVLSESSIVGRSE